MNIAIDAAPSSERQKSGIPVYTINILQSLLAIDSSNHYSIYGISRDNSNFQKSENVRIHSTPDVFVVGSYWYYWTSWYYTGFPVQLLTEKPDLFVSMYPAIPAFCPSLRIAFIYDLTPIKNLAPVSPFFRFKFNFQIKHAIKNTRIITISRSTRNDIIETLNVDPSEISIIYPGYDAKVFRPNIKPDLINEIKQKYRIENKYLLYSGTLEPKKNIPRLIEAFSYLKKNKNISYKLVISGKRTWGDEQIFQTVKNKELDNEVIFTGYVPQEDLPALVSGAELFIFPSIHEGFGIPPLEAMACATPVITSNSASLPEVVGDAGILVNPYDVKGLSEAIYRVITDNNLREQMRQKGLERAKLFSWEESARRTLALFESVYESSRKK